MILGLLADRGPMHGHQIRRTAELTNVEAWGGITGGALYGELHRLVADGLIRSLREEQLGRRPARTVYEITDDGGLELVVQREAALRSLFELADAVAVVLLFAPGENADALRARLTERRAMVASQLDSMTAERTRLMGEGFLSPLAIAAFRRGELRLEAELRWHDEFDASLSTQTRPPIGAPIRPLHSATAKRRKLAGDGIDEEVGS